VSNEDLAAMYAVLAREGYGIDVDRLRVKYPEVEWMGFADWAREIDWAAA
jgi:hypothetical protein